MPLIPNALTHPCWGDVFILLDSTGPKAGSAGLKFEHSVSYLRQLPGIPLSEYCIDPNNIAWYLSIIVRCVREAHLVIGKYPMVWIPVEMVNERPFIAVTGFIPRPLNGSERAYEGLPPAADPYTISAEKIIEGFVRKDVEYLMCAASLSQGRLLFTPGFEPFGDSNHRSSTMPFLICTGGDHTTPSSST